MYVQHMYASNMFLNFPVGKNGSKFVGRGLKIKSRKINAPHLLVGHRSNLYIFRGRVCGHFQSISQSTDSELSVHCELTLESQAIQHCSQGRAAPGADSDVCSFPQQKESESGSQLLC